MTLPGECDNGLSVGQEQLWFADRLEGASGSYIVHQAWKIRGRLDPRALGDAVAAVVGRHDSLRTSFPIIAGVPVAEVATSVNSPLRVFRAEDLDDRDGACDAFLRAEGDEPFALGHGPLVRAALLRLSGEDWIFSLAFHHAVIDGWSIAIVLGDLSLAYGAALEGRCPEFPSSPPPYSEFVQEQRAYLASGRTDLELQYWERQLHGVDPVLRLPGASSSRTTLDGDSVYFAIPSDQVSAVSVIRQVERASLFAAALTCFHVSLSAASARNDLVIGTSSAGRRSLKFQETVGFFVNPLPLRLDSTDDPSLLALMARARDTVLDAWSHQDVPLERLVRQLGISRKDGVAPLVQAWLEVKGRPRPLALRGAETSALRRAPRSTPAELLLELEETANGCIEGRLTFATDIYRSEEVALLVEDFKHAFVALSRGGSDTVAAVAVGSAYASHRPGSIKGAGKGREVPTERSPFPAERLEEILLGVWSQVLEVTGIGPDENFFDLGGDSVSAVRVAMNASEVLGREVSVELVLEHQTIAKLATMLAEGARRQGPDESREARRRAANMLRDARLPSIVARSPKRKGGGVLITGATGLLGSGLVRQLTSRAIGPVHCLVRADDEQDGRERIAKRQPAADEDALKVVVGDLEKPLLGLGDAEYESLAGEVDLVFHAGALVDLFGSYADLRPANVSGTIEMLRFSSEADARMVHISTVSTLASVTGRPLDPLALSKHPGWAPHGGYGQTKWVAEQLALQAQARELPITILRTSRIGGESATGTWSARDALARLLISCVKLRSAPLLSLECDVVPVDVLSSAIIDFAAQPTGVFNLRHPSPEPFSVLTDAVEEWAGQIDRVPAREWIETAAAVSRSDPSLLPVLPLVERLDSDAGARGALPASDLALVGVVPPSVRSQVGLWLGHFQAQDQIELPVKGAAL